MVSQFKISNVGSNGEDIGLHHTILVFSQGGDPQLHARSFQILYHISTTPLYQRCVLFRKKL